MVPTLASRGLRPQKNLYLDFVNKPTQENDAKYKKMDKSVKKHITKAKHKYYSDYFKQYSNDGRRQWTMINQLLNRRRMKIQIDKLLLNGQTITGQTNIAQTMNDYFCNIAENLKSPTNEKPHMDPDKRCYIDMTTEPTTAEEISKIIRGFENKSTADTSVTVLKSVNSQIAHIISQLINQSLTEGIFPTELKCAKVIPIHKSGPRTEPSNYRPISLLPLFSKIYERIMYTKLCSHLNENNVLNSTQFGFRSGHSCEHAILTAQNEILRTLDKSQIALLLLTV